MDAQRLILKDIKRDDPVEAEFVSIAELDQPSDFKVLFRLIKFQKSIHSKYLAEVRSSKKDIPRRPTMMPFSVTLIIVKLSR